MMPFTEGYGLLIRKKNYNKINSMIFTEKIISPAMFDLNCEINFIFNFS